MRQIRPEYEFPVEGRAWTSGALPEAGVYLLGSECHIVARHGAAAFELEARGALLMALVRFDDEPLDGARTEPAIRPLDLREAVARFAHPERGMMLRPEDRLRTT